MKAHHIVQGFIQLSLENLPGWRMYNFSWQTLLMVSNDEKCFPYIQPGFPLLPFMPFVPHPSAMCHSRAWLHLPDNLLIGTDRLLVRSPQSHLCSRLNKPSSLSLSSLAECSSPQPSWWPSANLFQFIQYISCSGGPKLKEVFRCDLTVAK